MSVGGVASGGGVGVSVGDVGVSVDGHGVNVGDGAFV